MAGCLADGAGEQEPGMAEDEQMERRTGGEHAGQPHQPRGRRVCGEDVEPVVGTRPAAVERLHVVRGERGQGGEQRLRAEGDRVPDQEHGEAAVLGGDRLDDAQQGQGGGAVAGDEGRVCQAAADARRDAQQGDPRGRVAVHHLCRAVAGHRPE